MNGLQIKRTIKATFSPHQWDLYTGSYLPECIEAARELNVALEEAFNQGGSRWDCQKQVRLVMDRYSDLGATDTEPRAFLEEVLDTLFK